MRRAFVLLILAGLISMVVVSETDALTKVQRDLNFMTVYAGVGLPVSTYDGFPGVPFGSDVNRYRFKADNVYDNALYLGLDYGKLFTKNISLSVGFRYISHQLKDTIGFDPYLFTYYPSPTPKLNQYDLGLELIYRLNNLREVALTPYAGLSMSAGFTTVDFGGVENENHLNLALSAEFGAEFKLWEQLERNKFVTLVVMNSYNFTATGDRPKYYHFGGGLRYYFND